MAVSERPEKRFPRDIERLYANTILVRLHRLMDQGQLTPELRSAIISEFNFDPRITDQTLHQLAI